MGSSRAEHAVDPALFSKDEQVFNLGEDGHGMPSNYILLQLLVKEYYLKIDTLLLQTDEFSFNGEKGFSREFRDDVFYSYLNNPEVYEAYKNYSGKSLAVLLKFFPQAGNLIYNDFVKFLKNYPLVAKHYSNKLSDDFQKEVNRFSVNKGYTPLYEAHKVNKTSVTTVYTLQPDDVAYFIKIVSFCKSNNIKLILFRAPVLYCEEQNSSAFDYYIDMLSKQQSILFFDYKCSYQYEHNYYNNTHFTDTIARLMTKDLITKLKSLQQ